MLCVEIDEYQHKYYIRVDEEQHYDDLFVDFSGKYIYIRYNLDSYLGNGNRTHPTFEAIMTVIKQRGESTTNATQT